MKIAIMHFHLRTGGVTSVIRHQVDVLGPDQTLLVTGERPAQDMTAPTVCVPDIAYDTDRSDWPPADRIADRIQDAIAGHWPTGCDILHVHNPTLGKNRDLPAVLDILARRGIRLFLHIHDLAEDGRPHLYTQAPYPSDCHYGVINSRDYHRLRTAGLNVDGLHLIEDAVMPLPANGVAPENRYVLYPIRAIRRKNIGEAILLATFITDPLWITLPPTSQIDIRAYQRWKKTAADLQLPVIFDAGTNRAFSDVVAGALSMITTSVAEGFGFAYLEPWTAERFLWGRAVPEITDGFIASGVRLDHLYSRLAVSLDWFEADEYRGRWYKTAAFAGHAFGRPVPESILASAYARLTAGGLIDFAYLDEIAQQQVLTTRHRSEAVADTLRQMNPILEHPGPTPDAADRIEYNRRVIRQRFHPEQYAATLNGIYKEVLTRTVRHAIDKNRLLAACFRPETLSLLKWSPHAP